MDIEQIKNTIRGLVKQSESVSKENDSEIQSSQFTRPFFESLGWDFNADVKSENFDGSEIKAFQIDSVTRFYLKEFPLTSPLESLTEEIKSAVSYAYNKGVTWAVITNFKETRVYNTESTGKTLASMQHYSFLSSEYIEKFQKLSDLTKKQFSLNVLDDSAEYFGKKPKRVSIDKQLLEDLLGYRNILVDDITKENSVSEEDAESAAQKILNRLVFIRSCGDRQIEDRLLKEELHKWEENKDKKLVHHLQDIFSYFRGRYGSTLFEKHLCDDLIISDKVLHQVIEGTYQSKKKAVRYNFAHIEHDSLGKMYENYLGAVQQKKDGAYYTPSYISKYICKNTIIPYLSKSDVTNIPDLISEYSDNLEELEAKIHDIKVLDPACGTGEFLIRAIDVLLEISTQIQAQKEASGKYTHTVRGKKSGSVSYQTFGKDVENTEIRRIIQNNIHGVDINEEAIEITQLNMFLKLATSSQQLIDLSKNVIVGNSLIEEPSVEPKPYNLKKTFPVKFDIIIGNPPYLRNIIQQESHSEYLSKYESATGHYDYYVLFVEKALKLLNINGKFGYIIPHKFFTLGYGKGIREFISRKYYLSKLIDFGELQIFGSATTYTCIILIDKNRRNHFEYCRFFNKEFVKNNLNDIDENNKSKENMFSRKYKLTHVTEKPWIFGTIETENLVQKIEKITTTLGSISSEIFQGLATTSDPVYIMDYVSETKNEITLYSKTLKQNIVLERNAVKPILKGAQIRRYYLEKPTKYFIFPYILDKGKAILIEPKKFEKNFPKTLKYLEKNRGILDEREKDKQTGIGKLARSTKWYGYTQEHNLNKFEFKKIMTQVLSYHSQFAIDELGINYFVGGGTAGGNAIILKESHVKEDNELYFYICGLLNSCVSEFYLRSKNSTFRGGYIPYGRKYTEILPIPLTMNQNKTLLKKEITKSVKKIISLLKDEGNRKQKNLTTELECKIDSNIFELFNLSIEDAKYILKYLKINEEKKGLILNNLLQKN